MQFIKEAMRKRRLKKAERKFHEEMQRNGLPRPLSEMLLQFVKEEKDKGTPNEDIEKQIVDMLTPKPTVEDALDFYEGN